MSRYSTRKSFDLEWVEQWARRVNEDRILAVIGRFFTGRFVLGIDENDYLIEVNKGKIQRIAEGLTANDFGFDFALRAPSGSWAKFAQPIPPPTFNDIWAMAIPCISICASKATHSRSGRTCGRSPTCSG